MTEANPDLVVSISTAKKTYTIRKQIAVPAWLGEPQEVSFQKKFQVPA